MSFSSRPLSKAGSLFLSTVLAFGGLTTSLFLPQSVFAANPVRVYVAGESIERRNCFASAPFTSTGALNRPTDNTDEEYGWMIPLAERLKLRQPGLGIQFVGAQPWARAEDSDYDPDRCAFMRTPGRTSAISGTSVDSWIEQRAEELTARTYCYDVAFASRGGNDGASSHEEYRSQLKDLVRRLARGSSCNPNPVIYVTGHMPDNQGTVSSLRARFSADPQQVVNELRSSDPGIAVRFIDVYSAFATNQSTTAFPHPAWLTAGGAFDIDRIDIDGLHPRRLASIYAGEVVADAININEFMWGASSSGSSSGAGSTSPSTTPTPAPAPAVTPTPAPVTTSLPTPAPIAVVTPAPTPVAAIAGRYDIGHPTLQDIWVDPVNGRNTNTGADRAHALQTLSVAKERLPQGRPLSGTGYRIMLTRGEYAPESMPDYWENYLGTAQFPIILQAADGKGTAIMRKDINSKNLHYFYLIDLNFERDLDLLHFELGDHILLRGLTLRATNAHETVKVNQSKYLYIEDSDISGADDNAIDFVAVQYGHIVSNKIHNAGDWCMYTKGGSASIRVEGNEIYDCGVGGYTAGQGTGFQYMVPPWTYYEASDIKFVNNVIHDTGTAGIGVNGGYNILFAYNTLYRVGIGHRGNHADHLFEANFGGQGCDNTEERTGCTTNQRAGGWGTTATGVEVPIPNKNVYVYNNLFVNPVGTSAPYLFQVPAAQTAASGSGLTGQIVADANLQIKGNIIADSSDDLGVGETTGCAPSNPTCNPDQLRRDNLFLRSGPAFTNAAAADFRLTTALTRAPMVIPAFSGSDRPSISFPVGELANEISTDRAGNARGNGNSVGAYVMGATSAAPVIAPAAPSMTPVIPSSPTSPAPLVEPDQRPESSPAPAPVGTADLVVSLYATPYPTVVTGATVSYRVTVLNAGRGDASNVVVRLTVPSSGQFVSAQPPRGRCVFTSVSREVTCNLGTLSVKDSMIFPVVFRVTAAGRFAPEVRVVSLERDTDATNNVSSVVITATEPLPNLQGSFTGVTQTCRRQGTQTRCSVRGTLVVRNAGGSASAASRVTVSIVSAQGRSIGLQTVAVPGLGVNGVRRVMINRTLGANVRGDILVANLDSSRKIRESSEEDNRVEVKMP